MDFEQAQGTEQTIVTVKKLLCEAVHAGNDEDMDLLVDLLKQAQAAIDNFMEMT